MDDPHFIQFAISEKQSQLSHADPATRNQLVKDVEALRRRVGSDGE